ncbi:hypothetical protein B2_32 [Stenotrophomonas phage B2]|nr:hypothetical protein B2_32 [Stenotrophomonas phage B2]
MIDLRAIRVGIEVNGRVHYYSSLDGMRIRATGTKRANPSQNEATVTLSGLKRETRDFLITETSPFNGRRSPKRLVLEVGRASLGLSQLFAGDIVKAEPSGPPDVDLELKVKTGHGQTLNVVSRAMGPRTQLSDICRSVADDLGVALNFQAEEKLIAGFQYSGGALGQVNRLAEAGGIRAFIDDDVLIVQPRGAATSGRVRVLNMNSGMVGIPRVDEKGLKVSFLIDGDSPLGGVLRLESKFNKAANGDYRIDQLGFEVASHEDPFFYHAVCSRL